MLGTVKFFNADEGFGFVRDDQGREYYFAQVDVANKHTLVKSEKVSFTPREGIKSLLATNVKPFKDDEAVKLLEEITTWKLEAKFEDGLRYFYHTREVAQIEAGAVCFVQGRKGTGKTAICQHLMGQKDNSTFCKPLSFKHFPINELYSLGNANYAAPNQYITLWKYLIYSTIAQLMIQNEGINTQLREMLEKAYPQDPGATLSDSISQWTDEGFELNLGPFKLGTKRAPKKQAPWIRKVEVLERLLLEHLDSSLYIVGFDELDEDYRSVSSKGGNDNYNALLIGLIKAVQDIKSIFSQGRYRLLPVVFLRDDIFKQLQDPDRTKWLDLTIELDWNDEKLRNLLAFRLSRAMDLTEPLSFDAAWEQVFSETMLSQGKHKAPQSVFDMMCERSHLRPRDLIYFLSLCAKEAVATVQPQVTGKCLYTVQKPYSDRFRSELEDELSGTLPNISEIFEVLSDLSEPQFTLADFTKVFNNRVNEGSLRTADTKQILTRLFDFSVVGNLSSGHRRFRYLDKYVRCNLTLPFIVHPSLHHALAFV